MSILFEGNSSEQQYDEGLEKSADLKHVLGGIVPDTFIEKHAQHIITQAARTRDFAQTTQSERALRAGSLANDLTRFTAEQILLRETADLIIPQFTQQYGNNCFMLDDVTAAKLWTDITDNARKGRADGKVYMSKDQPTSLHGPCDGIIAYRDIQTDALVIVAFIEATVQKDLSEKGRHLKSAIARINNAKLEGRNVRVADDVATILTAPRDSHIGKKPIVADSVPLSIGLLNLGTPDSKSFQGLSNPILLAHEITKAQWIGLGEAIRDRFEVREGERTIGEIATEKLEDIKRGNSDIKKELPSEGKLSFQPSTQPEKDVFQSPYIDEKGLPVFPTGNRSATLQEQKILAELIHKAANGEDLTSLQLLQAVGLLGKTVLGTGNGSVAPGRKAGKLGNPADIPKPDSTDIEGQKKLITEIKKNLTGLQRLFDSLPESSKFTIQKEKEFRERNRAIQDAIAREAFKNAYSDTQLNGLNSELGTLSKSIASWEDIPAENIRARLEKILEQAINRDDLRPKLEQAALQKLPHSIDKNELKQFLQQLQGAIKDHTNDVMAPALEKARAMQNLAAQNGTRIRELDELRDLLDRAQRDTKSAITILPAEIALLDLKAQIAASYLPHWQAGRLPDFPNFDSLVDNILQHTLDDMSSQNKGYDDLANELADTSLSAYEGIQPSTPSDSNIQSNFPQQLDKPIQSEPGRKERRKAIQPEEDIGENTKPKSFAQRVRELVTATLAIGELVSPPKDIPEQLPNSDSRQSEVSDSRHQSNSSLGDMGKILTSFVTLTNDEKERLSRENHDWTVERMQKKSDEMDMLAQGNEIWRQERQAKYNADIDKRDSDAEQKKARQMEQKRLQDAKKKEYNDELQSRPSGLNPNNNQSIVNAKGSESDQNGGLVTIPIPRRISELQNTEPSKSEIVDSNKTPSIEQISKKSDQDNDDDFGNDSSPSPQPLPPPLPPSPSVSERDDDQSVDENDWDVTENADSMSQIASTQSNPIEEDSVEETQGDSDSPELDERQAESLPPEEIRERYQNQPRPSFQPLPAQDRQDDRSIDPRDINAITQTAVQQGFLEQGKPLTLENLERIINELNQQ